MSDPGPAAPPLAPTRLTLAIAAVVDIALHARPTPVSAKMLAARHALPPRYLETVLQALVHCGILKGVRGPRGGYELARERRRITAGEVARATMALSIADDEAGPRSRLVGEVVDPLIAGASLAFVQALDAVSIDDLCRRAEDGRVFGSVPPSADFSI